MPEVPITLITGDSTDIETDYIDKLPVNMVGINKKILGAAGYMRGYPGLTQLSGDSNLGIDRAGVYNDVFETQYRVSGSKLVSISADGTVASLGTISGSGQATLEGFYSFNTQGIIADNKMWLYDPVGGLVEVTDADLGDPIDGVWVDGYYFLTDGDYLYHTDVDDETSIDPLNYATAEFMPDKTLGLSKTQDNKVIAWGRYTHEYFVNTARSNFAFERVAARAQKIGIVATHAKHELNGINYIVGGRKYESVGVHAVTVSGSNKLSTRTVDKIISKYTEDELSDIRVESRTEDDATYILFHFPDESLGLNINVLETLGKNAAWFFLGSYGPLEPTTFPPSTLPPTTFPPTTAIPTLAPTTSEPRELVTVADEYPNREDIEGLVVLDGEIFGIADGNLLKWDGVDSWERVASNPYPYPYNTYIGCIVTYDGGIYIGTTDGELWQWANPGWTKKANDLAILDRVMAMCVYKGKIYSSQAENGNTKGKLYEWNGVDAWLIKVTSMGTDNYMKSLEVFDNKLYGGSIKGELYYWDDVSAWVKVADALDADDQIYAMVDYKGDLYASPYNSVTASNRGRLYKFNGIDAWEVVADSYNVGAEYRTVYELYVYNRKLYAAASKSLLVWNDVDAWIEAAGVPQGSGTSRACCIRELDDVLYLGTLDTGLLLEWAYIPAPTTAPPIVPDRDEYDIPYSGIRFSNYRAINGVFDPRSSAWVYGDKYSGVVGKVTPGSFSQYGQDVPFYLSSPFINLETFSVDQIEIETIPEYKTNTITITVSVTFDGENYSSPFTMAYNKHSPTRVRFIARRLGYINNWVGFAFYGDTSEMLSFGLMKLTVS